MRRIKAPEGRFWTGIFKLYPNSCPQRMWSPVAQEEEGEEEVPKTNKQTIVWMDARSLPPHQSRPIHSSSSQLVRVNCVCV